MSQVASAGAEVLNEDPFDVLGLSKDASDDEIKSAHRKLALKYACWSAHDQTNARPSLFCRVVCRDGLESVELGKAESAFTRAPLQSFASTASATRVSCAHPEQTTA